MLFLLFLWFYIEYVFVKHPNLLYTQNYKRVELIIQKFLLETFCSTYKHTHTKF